MSIEFTKRRLTWSQWTELVDSGEVQDISNELSPSFLVVGQIMRAKIIYKGKKYIVSGWLTNATKPYANLVPHVNLIDAD